MSEAISEYRQVFIQQRLFNYGSILLAALAMGMTWLLIQLEVPTGWICAITFVVFYGITVMGGRVRTNPLIRCTIENADPRLYGNLWVWSILACTLSILAFAAASVLIWKMVPMDLSLKQFVLVSSILTSFMVAAAVE